MQLNSYQQNGIVVHIPMLVGDVLTGELWSNMPAALTEFQSSTHRRKFYDFTGMEFARLQANVMSAGAAPAIIFAQYSLDNGATWSNLITPTIALSSTGVKSTAYSALPANAMQNVLLRIVGSGGNGSTDPRISNISIDAK